MHILANVVELSYFKICSHHHLSNLFHPIAGQKCQVRSAAEGPVCGKLSAHESSSGDGAEAEECREEVLPLGGESDRS